MNWEPFSGIAKDLDRRLPCLCLIPTSSKHNDKGYEIVYVCELHKGYRLLDTWGENTGVDISSISHTLKLPKIPVED